MCGDKTWHVIEMSQPAQDVQHRNAVCMWLKFLTLIQYNISDSTLLTFNPQATNVIYIYIYIYIYMEHPFLMFLDRTQRRITVGRTPLDE